MKLNIAGYEFAKTLIASKAISKDDFTPDDSEMNAEYHLAMEDNGTYCHKFFKAGNCFPNAFKSIMTATKDHSDAVGNAARELYDMCLKEMPSLDEQPELEEPGAPEAAEPMKSKIGAKVRCTFSLVKDATLLAQLNKNITALIMKDNKSIDKAMNDKNGFWAIASLEQVDSDGDIIMVDGIKSDIDSDNGIFLPLLPSHLMKLPDGNSPEIGRVEKLVKMQMNGLPALCMFFRFALDENGVPLDNLVKSYYDRYRLNFANSFSVGMMATEEPQPIKDTGGYRFTATKLFEISCVSIPANSGAIGITRSASEDSELLSKINDIAILVQKIEQKLQTVNCAIDASFIKAFEPLETRLDILESHLVVQKEKTTVPKKDNTQELLLGINQILEKYSK